MVRRFLVHGSKVWLCHMGNEPVDDQSQWKFRPGMLPDFPDREVSCPMYRLGNHKKPPLRSKGRFSKAQEYHSQRSKMSTEDQIQEETKRTGPTMTRSGECHDGGQNV